MKNEKFENNAQRSINCNASLISKIFVIYNGDKIVLYLI